MSDSSDPSEDCETSESDLEYVDSSNSLPLCFEVDIEKDSEEVLGLNLGGGSDRISPFDFESSGVSIHYIVPYSPSWRSKKLQIADRVVAIGVVDLRNVNHVEAVNLIKECAKNQNSVKLKIERSPGVHEVVIKRSGICNDQEFGISVIFPQNDDDRRIFIHEVIEGSIAEGAGLTVGQLLIAINGETLFNATKSQLKVLLNWGSELRLLVAEPDTPFAQHPIAVNVTRKREALDVRFFNEADQFGFTVIISKNLRSLFFYLLIWFFSPTFIFSILLNCIGYLYSSWPTSGTEPIAEPAKTLKHIMFDESTPN